MPCRVFRRTHPIGRVVADNRQVSETCALSDRPSRHVVLLCSRLQGWAGATSGGGLLRDTPYKAIAAKLSLHRFGLSFGSVPCPWCGRSFERIFMSPGEATCDAFLRGTGALQNNRVFYSVRRRPQTCGAATAFRPVRPAAPCERSTTTIRFSGFMPLSAAILSVLWRLGENNGARPREMKNIFAFGLNSPFPAYRLFGPARNLHTVGERRDDPFLSRVILAARLCPFDWPGGSTLPGT